MDRYPDYDAMFDWQQGSPDPPDTSTRAGLEATLRSAVLSVSEPAFLGREREYVLDCIDRGWLTQGLYVGRLERGFQELLGRRFAIACNSGTSALHLAMLGLGLEPDDVVLVPALTYISTANAVSYCGAMPVFVDVNRHTWCMDPADVERKIKRMDMTGGHRIRGAIAVHLFDGLADIEAIEAVMPPETWIVEDAAQAIGGQMTVGDDEEGGIVPAGSLGMVSTFSMYGSKTITAGEGGMVVTDNQVTAEVMRLFRGQGAPRAGHYEHQVVGYNYRMTDIAAAIAVAQLECIDEHLERRRAVIEDYRQQLDELPVKMQTTKGAGGAWAMAVQLPPGSNVPAIRQRLLDECNVETRPFFLPLHMTEAYAEHHSASLPVSCQLYNRGLVLPTHANMSIGNVAHVTESLRQMLA